MDPNALVIKLLGIVMLFNAHNLPNGLHAYTVYAADGRDGARLCSKVIDKHHAYLRVIGPTNEVSWSTKPFPCIQEKTEPAGDCNLYELAHDDLYIEGISDETLKGVVRDASLGDDDTLPQLQKYGGDSNHLNPALAKRDSAAILPLMLGTARGIKGQNGVPSAIEVTVLKADVPGAQTFTIQSTTRPDHRIVVPAGAHIAIINATEVDAPHLPDSPGHGGEEHWFLHYKVLDNDPVPGKCKWPESNEHRVLNKACSPTTYP